MAIHEELNPDDAALPFMAARANRLLGTDNAARTAGVIVVPNRDGTDTVLGTNGVAPWVGDTTPPGKPLDIEATSHLGTALIRWGGELEGGIPSDFRCVQVWAKQVGATAAEKTLVGVLSSAGEVNTGVFDAGATLDVWATALDNAHDRDGSPAYNESVESEHVQVEILPIVSQQEFDEAADNILAAAAEDVQVQIDRVDADIAATGAAIDQKAAETLEAANQAAQNYVTTLKEAVDADLAETGEKIDQKAAETLEAAKADTQQHIQQVNKDIDAANKQIAANTSAVETEAQLRAEGDKKAQQATQAVKDETDKLKGDYAGMATDVANVQQSIVQVATKADTALATANGKNRRYVQPTAPSDTSVLVQGDEWWQTSSKPLETYWTGEPNNSPSVLVDHSNEVEHVWVWNGSRWNEQVLSAEHLLVPGSIATGLVAADFFDGAVIRGGAFLTSNELIQLNNAGLTMLGRSGETLVSLNATNGTATFNDVSIINGTLTTPVLEGGTINGGSFNLKDASGKIIGQFNTNGISFGDKLTFSKQNNEWVLNLKASIKSGSSITGASVTGGTVQTVADTNRGIKLVGGNLDIYRSDKTRFMRVNEDGLYISDGTKNVLSFARTLRTYWTGEPNNSPSVLVDGWQLTLDGALQSGGAISGTAITGGTVTGAIVQTDAASNRGVKLYSGANTTGNIDVYRADGNVFFRVNEAGLSIKDGANDVLTFGKVNNAWKLSLKGDIQSGSTISGATVVGASFYTNTSWDSATDAEKYRGIVITSGGMFAYKNNGKKEYSMSFTAATGELKLDGAIASNAVFNAPTISAGQMVGTNIYTGTDADNRVSITSAGLTVTHGGQTVISFAADGAVDLGTSGIAADSRVSDLTDEVHDSYTPLATFTQTTDALGESVTNVQTQVGATADRLDEEIDARKQYMQFDPNNGLTIGDLTNTDAYSVQLTSTAMQFRAGNTVAAYVSNDRLYINNAEVVNTLRIGNFAFLPRDNGHMSLQYVGGRATVQEV